MQQGSITNLHIARVKGTPSDPVQEATALSGKGLDGDRSCSADNVRQVLFMDKETLDRMDLQPGQINNHVEAHVLPHTHDDDRKHRGLRRPQPFQPGKAQHFQPVVE